MTVGIPPLFPSVVFVTSHFTFGNVGGNAAVHFALEVFQDFRAALRPLVGAGDLRAIFHRQHIRHGVFVGIGSCLFETLAGLILPVAAGTKLSDSKLIHHVLMVVEAIGRLLAAPLGSAAGRALRRTDAATSAQKIRQ